MSVDNKRNDVSFPMVCFVWGLNVAISVLLAWAYLLFWKQLFSPIQTFIIAFLYIFSLTVLIRAGFFRLAARLCSFGIKKAYQYTALLLLLFVPLVIPALSGNFSRSTILVCLAVYLLANLGLIAVFRAQSSETPVSKNILKDAGCILILAVLVFISYYKFLRLDYIFPPCDAAFVYYGSNLFLGRSITQGIFPLWNPYCFFGIPVYAVPEGQAFFPIHLLTAIFSPNYGFYHYMVTAFMLPQLIGGIGFFFLVRWLVRRRWIALTVAAAYCFSGYVAYPSSPTLIYSVAWIPWIILFSIRAFIAPKFRLGSCLAVAVFYALAIVTCYPILWYAMGFHIVLLALIVLVINYRHRFRPLLILIRPILILVLAAAFACPYLVAVKRYLPYTARGGALSYRMSVGFDNFTPRNLLTLWFPGTAMMDPDDAERERGGIPESYCFDDMNFNAQINTYRSVYITIPCFFFALIALLRWRKYRGLPLLMGAIALLYLLIAMGGHSFVYDVLYSFVPFFSHSRQTSAHRIFFITYLLLLSAVGMRITFRNVRDRFLDISSRLIVGLFLLCMFVLGLYLLMVVIPPLAVAHDLTLFSLLFRGVMYGLIFSLGTLLLLLGRRSVKYRRLIVGGLFILVVADALTAVYAQHYKCRHKQVDYEKSLEPLRKDFSNIPNRRRLVQWRSAEWVHDFQFTVGTHALNRPRAPGYEWHRHGEYSRYSTKLFKTYNMVIEVERGSVLEKMKRNPDSAVFLAPGTPIPAWFRQKESSAAERTGIKISWYAPNEARLLVSSSAGTFLEMLDMYYPGWKAYLDGAEVPIIRANFNSKGIFVPPGEHRVVFCFVPGSLIITLLLSAIVFCAAVLGSRPFHKI